MTHNPSFPTGFKFSNSLLYCHFHNLIFSLSRLFDIPSYSNYCHHPLFHPFTPSYLLFFSSYFATSCCPSLFLFFLPSLFSFLLLIHSSFTPLPSSLSLHLTPTPLSRGTLLHPFLLFVLGSTLFPLIQEHTDAPPSQTDNHGISLFLSSICARPCPRGNPSL